MKKIALFLLLAMTLSLAACAAPVPEPNIASTDTEDFASSVLTDTDSATPSSEVSDTDPQGTQSSSATEPLPPSQSDTTDTNTATDTGSATDTPITKPVTGPVYNATKDHRIILAENTVGSILVLDLDNCKGDWSLANWKKSNSTVKVKEFSTNGDTNVSDVKFRYSSYYRKDVLITASSVGIVRILDYSATSQKNAVLFEMRDFIPNEKEISLYNAHAAEILPNGDVVVATSGYQNDKDGSYYRNGGLHYYPAGSKTRAAFLSLPFAHAVLWDDKNECLWAVGFEGVVAVKISGYGSNATMEKIEGMGCKKTNFTGHDMVPAYGMEGKFWVTDNSRVYLFDSATGELSKADQYTKGAVKGAAYFEDGTMVQAHWTKNLTLCLINEAGAASQKITLALPQQIYKVRTFSKNYT